MEHRPHSPEELSALENLIDAWATEQLSSNPAAEAVERDTTETRWFVRLRGEEKDVFTVWFWLKQRSLHVETFLMPAPAENCTELFEHLLRRNAKMGDFHCAIGPEDAVYIMTRVHNHSVDAAELDRLLGSAYFFTEQFFRPAMRIGYASVFRG